MIVTRYQDLQLSKWDHGFALVHYIEARPSYSLAKQFCYVNYSQ